MSTPDASSVAIWPYVLIWSLIKLIYVAVLFVDLLSRDINLSANGFIGIFVNILAFAITLKIYVDKAGQKIQLRDMLAFSAGVVIADSVLSFVFFLGTIFSLYGAFSPSDIGDALGTPGPFGGFILAAAFAALTVFLQAMLFTWLFTRKLPRRGPAR
jgi:hypothetical protein